MTSACGLATPLLDRAVDEAVALLVHLRLDLLTHGAAQQVGFAERIARQHLRDLHHLFLVDDNALGLLEQMVDRRMDRLQLLLAMLAGVVGRDVFHRARTIERDERDDVLDAVRPHADQRLAHAGTFHLEHADRFAARQHLVGLFIVERDAGEIDADPALGDEIDGDLQHRQRLQAEEVELHQPRLLDPLHVELGDRHVGARIAVHRHQLRQRPVADDDAGGVGRGVAVKPFDLLGDVEQAGDDRLLLGLFPQFAAPPRSPYRAASDWPDCSAPACRSCRPGHRAFPARGRRRAVRRAPAANRR